MSDRQAHPATGATQHLTARSPEQGLNSAQISVARAAVATCKGVGVGDPEATETQQRPGVIKVLMKPVPMTGTETAGATTEDRRDALLVYLDAVYANGHGHVAVALGEDARADNGVYKTNWINNQFVYSWPDDVEKIASKILEAECDVYICPYLLTGRRRHKGTSVDSARTHVHADIDLVDGQVDLDAVSAIPGAVALGSGTPGNAHVYVLLANPVTLNHHEQLCRGLGAYLDTTDTSKYSDNDCLRPPGAFNYKPTVMNGGGGAPAPVQWLIKPTGDRVHPQKLAELLGIELTDGASPTTVSTPSDASDGAIEEVLQLRTRHSSVYAAQQRITGDRSKDTMLIVSACRGEGLTLAQARWVVASRPDLAERLDERRDDDVARCWERAVDRELDVVDGFEQKVREEMDRMRVRETARQRFAHEKSGAAASFDSGLLDEILARPHEPPYRIFDLLPADGGMLVVAQRKTGKTTLMLNLAHTLITAEPLLGRFSALPVAGRVAILNYEVSGSQLARWASQAGVPSERLLLVNLRGRRDPLAHDDDRRRLADLLHSHEVESLIVDPFGRAYTGKSQNDSGEVGAWLVDLDDFTRSEVGARDLIVTAHAGWNGERTRGSSALEDWADSIVTMTLGNDGNSRYLRAIGRDVAVDEDLLYFDPESRLLSLTGTGSRKQTTDAAAVEATAVKVCDYLKTRPGASFGDINKAIEGRQNTIRQAIELAEGRGDVRRVVGGTGKSNKHFRVDDVHVPRDGQSGPGQ